MSAFLIAAYFIAMFSASAWVFLLERERRKDIRQQREVARQLERCRIVRALMDGEG